MTEESMIDTPAKPPVKTRLCAVCGKRTTEPTMGFGWSLKMADLFDGKNDKAHASCIRKLNAEISRKTIQAYRAGKQ